MKALIAILSLFTVALTLPLQAAPEAKKSLYERLGGVFAIAAVRVICTDEELVIARSVTRLLSLGTPNKVEP